MIIVDTGFWLTLANKNDSAHPAAKTLFQNHSKTYFSSRVLFAHLLFPIPLKKL
ncbi:hypothetical protein NIVACYA_02348 [Planktothrix agardhii]|nr:hypothetical protein NIVACYA_02348 [Planktothrix agardhii]